MPRINIAIDSGLVDRREGSFVSSAVISVQSAVRFACCVRVPKYPSHFGRDVGCTRAGPFAARPQRVQRRDALPCRVGFHAQVVFDPQRDCWRRGSASTPSSCEAHIRWHPPSCSWADWRGCSCFSHSCVRSSWERTSSCAWEVPSTADDAELSSFALDDEQLGVEYVLAAPRLAARPKIGLSSGRELVSEMDPLAADA